MIKIVIPQYPWGIGSRAPCRYQNPQMLKSLTYLLPLSQSWALVLAIPFECNPFYPVLAFIWLILIRPLGLGLDISSLKNFLWHAPTPTLLLRQPSCSPGLYCMPPPKVYPWVYLLNHFTMLIPFLSTSQRNNLFLFSWLQQHLGHSSIPDSLWVTEHVREREGGKEG